MKDLKIEKFLNSIDTRILEHMNGIEYIDCFNAFDSIIEIIAGGEMFKDEREYHNFKNYKTEIDSFFKAAVLLIDDENVFYIQYLDSKNKFKKTKRFFSSYQAAKNWMFETMEKPSLDLINIF